MLGAKPQRCCLSKTRRRLWSQPFDSIFDSNILQKAFTDASFTTSRKTLVFVDQHLPRLPGVGWFCSLPRLSQTRIWRLAWNRTWRQKKKRPAIPASNIYWHSAPLQAKFCCRSGLQLVTEKHRNEQSCENQGLLMKQPLPSCWNKLCAYYPTNLILGKWHCLRINRL